MLKTTYTELLVRATELVVESQMNFELLGYGSDLTVKEIADSLIYTWEKVDRYLAELSARSKIPDAEQIRLEKLWKTDLNRSRKSKRWKAFYAVPF